MSKSASLESLVNVTALDNGIFKVSLNRPEKLNALNKDMFDALERVGRRLRKDTSVRAIILTGEGSDFCSGLDVKSVLQKPSLAVRLLAKLNPWSANQAQIVSQIWRKIPVPVIAQIQGRCWGGGLQIALGADFRVADSTASFSIMESRYGLIPDMAGNLALRQIMPLDQALWLAMSAEVMDAESALKYGLITHMTDNAEQHCLDMANRLLEKSPDCLAAVKKLYIKQWNDSDGGMLARESWYQIKILAGKNQRLAVKRSQDSSIKYHPRSKSW